MSYDYLDDQFGRYRQQPTKFTETENKAVELLKEYARGNVPKDDFGERMMQVSRDFNELMKDESGCYVFSQDTPLWLNSFLGNKFARWNKIRLMVNAAKEKPEMVNSPDWRQVEELVIREDSEFMKVIKYCLDELAKTQQCQ